MKIGFPIYVRLSINDDEIKLALTDPWYEWTAQLINSLTTLTDVIDIKYTGGQLGILEGIQNIWDGIMGSEITIGEFSGFFIVISLYGVLLVLSKILIRRSVTLSKDAVIGPPPAKFSIETPSPE